jgi:hypothetical protein
MGVHRQLASATNGNRPPFASSKEEDQEDGDSGAHQKETFDKAKRCTDIKLHSTTERSIGFTIALTEVEKALTLIEEHQFAALLITFLLYHLQTPSIPGTLGLLTLLLSVMQNSKKLSSHKQKPRIQTQDSKTASSSSKNPETPPSDTSNSSQTSILTNPSINTSEDKVIPEAITNSSMQRSVRAMAMPQESEYRFDGQDVTEFIEWYEMNSDMAELKDAYKVMLLPRYCEADTREVIKSLDGFEARDWGVLKKEVLHEYKSQDSRKF